MKDTQETNTPEQQQKELLSLAQTIRDYQKQRAWSDTQLCKRYGGVGSTKTYARLLAGDLKELDTERWLLEYRSVVNLIEAEGGAESVEEELYDDLSTCVRMRIAFLDVMNTRGNNRLVIIEGVSGSGKTKAARMLAARYGRRVVLAEADETWKSLTTMLGGLLAAIGVKELPGGTAERKEMLLSKLQAGRVCLAIDEAHHLGPASLNMLKTILNQTPGEVLLIGLGTLLRRLETQAYYEALQLTRNRMSERLSFDPLDARDVELMIKRRLGWDGEAKKGAAMLLGTKGAGPAARHGHLAFVDRVCRRAKRLADGDEMTLELFARAITETEASR